MGSSVLLIVCAFQELELANRYMSTLDVLLGGGSTCTSASLAGLEAGSPFPAMAATAAAAAAAAALDPAAAAGLGSLRGSLGPGGAALDARIRRVLQGQAAKAEAAEVCW